VRRASDDPSAPDWDGVLSTLTAEQVRAACRRTLVDLNPWIVAVGDLAPDLSARHIEDSAAAHVQRGAVAEVPAPGLDDERTWTLLPEGLFQ
jgi:hypothetical protein